MFHSCKLSVKQMFFTTVCFSCLVGMFYLYTCTSFTSTSFNLTGPPSVAVNANGVVALTGFLSISQHQLNSKASHSLNLHITRVNLSSLRKPTIRSSDDSWENLEWYTLPKQRRVKPGRKTKSDDEIDEKYLRNDERSIARIVNGLADADSEKLPKIFRKEGMPKKRFPNVIIIGVKKGGTRALLEMIKLHPQVCSCGPEIHYFDRYYSNGLQWYQDKMPLCYENEITIEKTPSYFVTYGVAKDMFDYSKLLTKTLKLIVIVRDPTRRAISDFTQTQSNGNKSGFTKTFEGVALKHSHDGKISVNTQRGAIKIGVYSKHLKRWLKYFKRSQIHIVSGEILTKQPYEELRKVEKFLELPAFIKPKHFVYNETKGFYCLDKGINELNTGVNASLPLRCLGSSKGRAHVFVSNETEKMLRDYYRPFNQEFYDLIGRDLAWP